MWHSCTTVPLERHFEGRDPAVRAVFDRFLDMIRAVGPVEVIPQKTRIAIMVAVRFAACMPRKRWMLLHLWLGRPVAHPHVERVDRYGDRAFVHRFRFDDPEQLDDAFEALVRASYAVGTRRHLRDAGT